MKLMLLYPPHTKSKTRDLLEDDLAICVTTAYLIESLFGLSSMAGTPTAEPAGKRKKEKKTQQT